jgi:hypothetical protein
MGAQTHLHEVAVAAHEEAGTAVVLTLLAQQIPLQKSFVSGARHEHVHGLFVGVGGEGDGSDPSVVANEGSNLRWKGGGRGGRVRGGWKRTAEWRMREEPGTMFRTSEVKEDCEKRLKRSKKTLINSAGRGSF